MKQLELRGIMWILGVIILLMASETSQKPGTNHNNQFNSTITLDVYRNKTVNQGNTVNLTCANKTRSEMLYTIWTIDLEKKQCRIAFNDVGHSENSCKDGKTLHNKSTGESYLFIPNISNSDEGVYKCESAYKGGSDSIIYNVSVTVPPHVSATLQLQDGRRVAVCLAERGKPAATIVWVNMENDSPVPRVDTLHHPDGLYTVKSQLDLREGEAIDNLTCAIHHPFWDTAKIITPQASTASPASPLLGWLLITLLAVSVIGILLGLLYFTQRNLIVIRHCWKSNPTTPSEAKSPPTEEVEEVEPYASYVQRVNSIYNSSADLFT